ncbi:MAG: hypothetical protein JSV44_02040 [Candidatus Zixiibacteriota bacterium]|nr:MAG: hypothetical protein JSV44_02040 [candidate division Zixibacteria bacterium]
MAVSNGAASDSFSIYGFSKSFSVVNRYPEWKRPDTVPNPPDISWISNRLRFNLKWNAGDPLALHFSYDLVPRLQHRTRLAQLLSFMSIDPLLYRIADLDSRLYPSPDASVRDFMITQNLDRAYAVITASFADIMVGRQPVAWGTARVINPMDIIAPYAYGELDTEDRIGVDAARVRVPLGFMGEFDGGYVFGRDGKFKNSALFLRTKLYAAGTDMSLIMLGFHENLLAGFDLVRAIGGAGFWLEGAQVFVDALADSGGGHDDYFRASVGADYSFGDRLYGFAEYHYNQVGTTEPEDYLTNLSHPAYTEGAVYLLGEHYLTPGITYQFSPLVICHVQALCNLTDPSAYVTPQLEINITQNAYLAGGAYLGIGKTPEFAFESFDSYTITFRSEFRGYPNTFFAALNVYF